MTNGITGNPAGQTPNPTGRFQALRNTKNQLMTRAEDAFINRAINLTVNTAKSSRFWLWLITILFFVGSYLWIKGYLKVTVLFILQGLLFLLFIILIFWGFWSGVKKEDSTYFFIAFAFIIWIIDLLPSVITIPFTNIAIIDIGQYIGPPYAGFKFDLSGVLNTTWAAVMTSSVIFIFLVFSMFYDLSKKHVVRFVLSFVLIFAINQVANVYYLRIQQYFALQSGYFGALVIILVIVVFALLVFRFRQGTAQPSKFFGIGFGVPATIIALFLMFGLFGKDNAFKTLQFNYVNYIFLALIIFMFIAFFFLKDKFAGTDMASYPTYIFMAFVFSFFWVNIGWIRNIRADLHVLYILIFGFGYIARLEKENPAFWHILIPGLIIADFYGYGLLWNSGIEVFKFIPMLVLFVLFYCYLRAESTYALASLFFVLGIFLIFTIQSIGVEATSIQFEAIRGADYKDFYSQFKDKLTELIESRLDIATAGLYRGNVEKNRYESLGVYFSNLRAADPKFYTDEPITVWGSIRSKTYQDAVIINFSCYRWKDNKKIRADKIIPDIKFPIFTLEEVDTECTFLPPKKEEKDKEIKPGQNIITFSAEYNFGTDAYIKAYFMDRDRFRAYSRENLDPLTELGIKDKKPAAVHTNGPVEIGLDVGQLPITVSEGYAVKPAIGITLTNRKEIQDKDKRIISRWDGKIKNITELILLTPPGVELPDIKSCSAEKNSVERLKCPCSMPFVEYDSTKCKRTCDDTVYKPCVDACSNAFKKDDTEDPHSVEIKLSNCINECSITNKNCEKECDFLFEVGEGEGPTKEKYNGYALDVGSLEFKDLNKDIDKHRSFVCRFDTKPKKLLDDTPITTRYFRVRARYNYLLENSVTINVESLPVEVISTVPEPLVKIPLEFQPGADIWLQGFRPDLIAALSLIESGWRHCCSESGKNYWHNCKKSDELYCGSEQILTSYDKSSVGMMQINKKHESLASSVCNGKTIYDRDCNIQMGIKILRDNYDKYKGGIPPSLLAKYCPPSVQPERYRKYSNYKGVEAALRAYNGLGCRPEAKCEKACKDSKDKSKCIQNCVDGTVNYVERVIDKYNKIKDGVIVDNSGIRSIISSEDVPSQSTEDETASVGSTQKPLPPTNARAVDTPNTGKSITVSWSASPTPSVRYLVYRYKQQTGESTASYDSAETKYVDKNVEDEVNYYYRITAYSDVAESNYAETPVVKSVDDTAIFVPLG
ncbi:transglycosylase SLT domain-containing protein [Candidatus Woesearchaeota archaeon]|nr:transglycosylase SLT domain-containing protein [Candidatus Woesearchaeota archaeon]